MRIDKKEILHTDILIIGGGTAGCYAAMTIREHSDYSVIIAEKANIKRSGCLAAGVNALNAYITKGHVPQDYVDYADKDADHIVRQDLLLTMSEGLNRVTAKMEQLGLVILKDENGEYVARGNRNIKINGENFKPLLAEAVSKLSDVTVINRLNITDYIVDCNQIKGAFGFSIAENKAYEIRAKKVLIATGGAAGLYRPNNPGFSRHKMWYPPFNTGAGYAMGIRAGAEMTTFEMRFIALRCKDTIAPTGTIAQGVGAKQVNSLGEVYENKYGLTTSQRVYGTVKENLEGRGPCYLRTEGITKEQDESLRKAYLNMAPSQTLKWVEAGKNPSEQNVEIEGTEPYIVGGHTASGYWVDTHRETTIHGLFAAGDVAGGCPQKYVTGALVEGEIAALRMMQQLDEETKLTRDGRLYGNKRMEVAGKSEDADLAEEDKTGTRETEQQLLDAKIAEYDAFLQNKSALFTVEQLEEAMQKVMDTYAGGIGSHYQFNGKQLDMAEEKIRQLQVLAENLHAEDMHEMMFVYELKERLTVCLSVIAHLRARKETRWHSFAENLDYPDKSDDWLLYVNSKMEDGELKIIYRDLVKKGETYEHSN
ncbi:MAG: adenylyl-sulfate reductase subunit alpha [Agathobacter sp.]